MQYGFIAIEGNIGAGKTTVANKLAAHYQASPVLETFSNNPFLSDFYEHPEQYALPLELHFLMDRYEQLQSVNSNTDLIIADYVFGKSSLFAGVTLSERELDLFKKIASNLKPKFEKPDLLIYLHTSINRLKQNIEKRGRVYEKNISPDYLEKLQNAYQPFLKHHPRVLVVEMNDVDFEQEEQFKVLTDFLDKDYDFENHILHIK